MGGSSAAPVTRQGVVVMALRSSTPKRAKMSIPFPPVEASIPAFRTWRGIRPGTGWRIRSRLMEWEVPMQEDCGLSVLRVGVCDVGLKSESLLLLADGWVIPTRHIYDRNFIPSNWRLSRIRNLLYLLPSLIRG